MERENEQTRSPKVSNPDELVTIARFTLAAEADLVVGRLESAGIDCVLQDEHVSTIYTFGLAAMGGMRLQVRAEDEEDARAILADEGV